MAQSAIPRLKFLDYHHMIMQAMRSCEMCCELPYILKKKMLHRNGGGSAKP
jgi:hypothetical protein